MVIGVGPLEGDLGNESGTLIKEIPKTLLPLPPCEDTGRKQTCQSGRSLSPNP